MSIEQLTIDELETETRRPHERVLDGEGARYGRGSETERAPADAGCCRSCGESVYSVAETGDVNSIKRVLGDEHGRVQACPDCTDMESFAKALQSQERTTDRAREISTIEAASRQWGDL